MATIQAVLFDLDGVLIFSERAHWLAFAQVAQQHFAVELSLEEYTRVFAGRTDIVGWETFCQQHNLPCDLDWLLPAGSDAYLELFETAGEPNWPVVTVLRQVADQGTQVGITTSSTQRELEACIRRLGLSDVVQSAVSADMVTHGKPHPEPYLLTAQKLGIVPSRAVVIEDSPAGIQSARAAGMRCIAVVTTHQPHELQLAHLVTETLTFEQVIGQPLALSEQRVKR